MIRIPPVVLVADPLDQDPKESWDPFDRRHDRPWKSSVECLANALRNIAPKVTVHTDINNFVRELPAYREQLVLPYWFGQASRSRHGWVPAMCEAVGVPYVGPDAYTKIVTADKTLSKTLCAQVGIATPEALVIHGMKDISHIPDEIGASVVKPNCEGCSLGIDQDGPITGKDEIARLATRIIVELGGPALVEKFVPGREVSICLMGGGDHAHVRTLSWRILGEDTYLDERLFTARLKTLPVPIEPVEIDVGDEVRERCKRLFRILDKVEILRVDGRLRKEDGLFVAFEVTADVDLSFAGEWPYLYRLDGRNYGDFVYDLLHNALEGRS